MTRDRKNITWAFLMATALSLAPMSDALSHRGGMVKSGTLKGCHSDGKKDQYHCHSGKFKGQVFKSKKDALAGKILKIVETKNNEKSLYDRSNWKHWTDEDRDCQNTRHEILIKRSKKPVKMKKGGCLVLTGEWDDFYYPEKLTKASQIDIDHVVPLKHAFDSGGANWSPHKKEVFANDPENLVITNLKYNRQKGAQTPLSWLPVNKEYACRYIEKWLQIKKKYGLEVSPELKPCENSVYFK